MNTGLPIFIDWKHHAFKYDEIIHFFKERLEVFGSKTFYKIQTNFDDLEKLILENINFKLKKSRIFFL